MIDANRGRIVTFYSYKGGTGRSMALANVAWILAASGAKVLVIDWDLEAPGLHRYFRPFLTDPDLLETKGLIDAFWDATADQVAELAEAWPASDANTSARVATKKSVASDVAPTSRFAARLLSVRKRLHGRLIPGYAALGVKSRDWDNDLFSGEGCIDFIGPGRQGSTYSERVNTFDWRGFYQLGGAELLMAAAAEMRGLYDWVLIDSRTGVSDTSGICTMQLPDIVVPCLTLNRQSIDGVSSVLASIRAWQANQAKREPIVFLPVITRIENAEQRKLQRGRRRARAGLREYLPGGSRDSINYWNRMEVAYRPWYAFEEVLAPFGDETGAGRSADSMLAQMESLVEVIVDPYGDQPPREALRTPEIPEGTRTQVLRIYEFETDASNIPDQIDRVAPKESAAPTAVMHIVQQKELAWRASNKNYKWLLSLRELELLTSDDLSGVGGELTYFIEVSKNIHAITQKHANRLRRILEWSYGVGVFVFLTAGIIINFTESRQGTYIEILLNLLFILFLSVLSGLAVSLINWSIYGIIVSAMNALSRRRLDGFTRWESILFDMNLISSPDIEDFEQLIEKLRKQKTTPGH